MKSSGITRPVDALGRVVIPMEIRDNLNIKQKDLLDITVDGNQIILKKHGQSCTFCDSADDLVNFKHKKICRDCLSKLAEFN